MVCLILTHNVIRIYHKSCWRQLSYLWPTCTRGFGIREKIPCGFRFFGVFLCGFAVFGPHLRPPPLVSPSQSVTATKFVYHHSNNNNNKLYLHDRKLYSIAKAAYNKLRKEKKKTTLVTIYLIQYWTYPGTWNDFFPRHATKSAEFRPICLRISMKYWIVAYWGSETFHSHCKYNLRLCAIIKK